mmetsp:Transcript_29945/g.62594  ORF Transcript_29945/g.62594 Transcript_29945/m.62594 type:complete len:249 (-) Transcript_29945:1605-2351(-)
MASDQRRISHQERRRQQHDGGHGVSRETLLSRWHLRRKRRQEILPLPPLQQRQTQAQPSHQSPGLFHRIHRPQGLLVRNRLRLRHRLRTGLGSGGLPRPSLPHHGGDHHRVSQPGLRREPVPPRPARYLAGADHHRVLLRAAAGHVDPHGGPDRVGAEAGRPARGNPDHVAGLPRELPIYDQLDLCLFERPDGLGRLADIGGDPVRCGIPGCRAHFQENQRRRQHGGARIDDGGIGVAVGGGRYRLRG